MKSDSNDLVTVGNGDIGRLLTGTHHDPHSILGRHGLANGRTVVRSLHPDAIACEILGDAGFRKPMLALDGGLFEIELDLAPAEYHFRFHFAYGASVERGDPYRFWPTLGELDLYLLGEGTHRKLWQALGARPMVIDGVVGVAFSVWAPSATRVSLIGDFCGWDGRIYPMRSLGASGVWELFVPGLKAGALYKFEIRSPSGELRVKADPCARQCEEPPKTASVVPHSAFQWTDGSYQHLKRNRDITREPVHVYELHLGSFARIVEEGNRSLTYREIAPRLAAHAKNLGFTHVEFMPLSEHPYYPSWGYQVTGYFAPTSRYGSPDDLKYLINYLHNEGIGVIMDWVPAHFPKDDFALRRFDGTALYEHDDVRRGEHPDWGTLIFNYDRAEVRAFLISNAIYWLEEYHIDGLRVDAVASMLYLDYSRSEHEWVANEYGGRENIGAIQLLRQLNVAVREECPGCFTVAEESTSWGGVTASPADGGLGFHLKWNMGWMHDTIEYFKKEPIHRKFHQDQLTFAMLYEHTERFVNAISHDEVVHGKGALIEKMPGDIWQKLANLRVLLGYQVLRPGKQLMFMGCELGQHTEWNVHGSVDWHLADFPDRQKHLSFVAELGRLYRELPELWRSDPDPEGFAWIDCADRDNSILIFRRQLVDQADHVVVVMNLTPVPREGYQFGVPEAGVYEVLLNSDDERFGGSNYLVQRSFWADQGASHGLGQSVVVDLPPLSVLVLKPRV
jgi:1,4-alpha-glucan branching enzyme